MRAFLRTMEIYLDSCVRGLHISKHFWTLTIGETFVCEREPENPYVYAVAVMANSIMVSYAPRKISTACSLFLHQNGSTVHWTNQRVTSFEVTKHMVSLRSVFAHVDKAINGLLAILYWQSLIWQFASKNANPPS